MNSTIHRRKTVIQKSRSYGSLGHLEPSGPVHACGGIALHFTEGFSVVDGSCECGNELSGSIKCGKFLD
jgi:hypothetical protein